MIVGQTRDDERANESPDQGGSPHLLAYFSLFNRGLYHEAHDALEVLWHPRRDLPVGNFYKALIQVAGGFYHLQNARPLPGLALLKRARLLLETYPAVCEQLDLARVKLLLEAWIRYLESGRSFAEVGHPNCSLPLPIRTADESQTARLALAG